MTLSLLAGLCHAFPILRISAAVRAVGFILSRLKSGAPSDRADRYTVPQEGERCD